jgi:ribosomal protein L40E
MMAPIATAAAKSIAVHCAIVRRCAARRPSTAVA